MAFVPELPCAYPGVSPREPLDASTQNHHDSNQSLQSHHRKFSHGMFSNSSLGHPNPLRLHPVNHQQASTRRISASFSMEGPPSCPPTVATTSLTASTMHGELTLDYARTHRHPVRKITPTNIPQPKASTATTYESAMRYHPQNHENMPPLSGLQHKHKNSIDIMTGKLGSRSNPRSVGRLPKANTLNIISNLTASISRNSLSRFSRSTSISSIGACEPRISIASDSSLTLGGVENSDPRQVHTAQSSAYWTGRFLALQDRFRDEMLLPDNMATLITIHAENSTAPVYKPQASAHIPSSASNPNLMRNTARGKGIECSESTAPKSKVRLARGSLDAPHLEDDENRACRVFLHLEALCVTSEARKSLRGWQQDYARRMGKGKLPLKGGSMEGKGWVGRLLRRGSHDGKQGSLASVAFR